MGVGDADLRRHDASRCEPMKRGEDLVSSGLTVKVWDVESSTGAGAVARAGRRGSARKGTD